MEMHIFVAFGFTSSLFGPRVARFSVSLIKYCFVEL